MISTYEEPSIHCLTLTNFGLINNYYFIMINYYNNNSNS